MKKSKEKKGMPDWVRITLFTIVIIGVIAGLGFASFKVLVPKKEATDNAPQKNVVSIEGYGIHYDETDSNLYKEEYEKLKANLTSSEINYDEYAESVAKMFIIDLYTIKNKSNKYDVGGVDFVYPDGVQNYRTNVTDTIYKYVEDNSQGKRKQSLPVVESIEVKSSKKSDFTIGETKYEATKFDLTWTYAEDLGYDSSGEVIVIKKDQYMYVVEKN